MYYIKSQHSKISINCIVNDKTQIRFTKFTLRQLKKDHSLWEFCKKNLQRNLYVISEIYTVHNRWSLRTCEMKYTVLTNDDTINWKWREIHFRSIFPEQSVLRHYSHDSLDPNQKFMTSVSGQQLLQPSAYNDDNSPGRNNK
jgi:hypothetical protein